MQFTRISWDFKLFLIALGITYFLIAWIGEDYVFPKIARLIGYARQSFGKTSKRRKEYKLIQERIRI